jgi:energy-coupling factor transporter ATP-binding protein EcfA2
MKLDWYDLGEKLNKSTLKPVFVVWGVLCVAALILILTVFRSAGTSTQTNTEASKPTKIIGDVSRTDIGNLGRLWFSPGGSLVGVRKQETRVQERVQVYVWNDPLRLDGVKPKEIDLLTVAGVKTGDDPRLKNSVGSIQLDFAVSRDGDTVAVLAGTKLFSVSLVHGSVSSPYQLSSEPVNWIAYTEDRLLILYANGTLESRGPRDFDFLGQQDTTLDNPARISTTGKIVLVASFKTPGLRVYDFGHTTNYVADSKTYSVGTEINSLTPPSSVRLNQASILAVSGAGAVAYSVGAAVAYFAPRVINSGVNPGPPTELQAPGTVRALAFNTEDLLAGGDFVGIRWLGKSTFADNTSNPALLTANSGYIAMVTKEGDLQSSTIATKSAEPATVAQTIPLYSRLWFILVVWAVVAGLPLWPLVLHSLRKRFFPKATIGAALAPTPDEPPRQVLSLPYPPADLVKACATGECVLYAGAGLSVPAGFPTFPTFVRDLTDWTIENQYVSEELARSLRATLQQDEYGSVADNLGSELESHRDQLITHLREIFIKPAIPPPALKPLSGVPFSAVMTTSFDNLLENTYQAQKSPVYTVRDSEKLLDVLSKRGFFFLKLFGALDQSETVMISPGQYEDATRRNFQFTKFMETLFFSRTLLFVGASLEGIESYLRGISISKQNRRTHYAVVAVTDESWRTKAHPLESRYGIKVLPYTAKAPNHPELQTFLSQLEKEVREEHERTKDTAAPTACLKKLELTDIGPFEKLEVEFDQKWNIVLGDNGSGKSTILKAIAISILGEDAKTSAGRLVRAGKPFGEITLSTERNKYRTIVTPTNGTARVESIPGRAFESEGWLAMGFPPLRTVSWSRPKAAEAQTKGRPTPDDLLPLVVGDPDPRLDKLKQWIVNLDYWIKDAKSRGEDYGRYQRLLDDFFEVVAVLTTGQKVEFVDVTAQTNEIRIKTQDGILPLESLSQGMTSLIGWVGILLQRLYELYGDDENPRHQYALVLMDEIDAHLHPAWQQTLVRNLSQVFPQIQFIATTHSPLIVAGMNPEQIKRFARDEDGHLAQLPVGEEMMLGRADQILTGDLFGLQTTFSLNDDLQKDKDEYHKLLALDQRTESEELRFQKLRKSLRTRIPMSGEGPVERKAIQLVTELIKDESDGRFPSMNEELIEKAKILLEEVGKKRQ